MGRLLLVPYIREVIRELIKANAFEHLLKKEVVALERSDFGLNRVGDSRIAIVLIQTPGWAEASRRCRSHIRKICATG